MPRQSSASNDQITPDQKRSATNLRSWMFGALAFVLGVAWFVWRGGGRAINPTSLDWQMRLADGGWQILAWLFYRKEPWHFPLGLMQQYPDPVGTSLAYCDMIPHFAVFFKLFRAWLPSKFQYFGIYLVLCFGMQGYFGYRLIRLYSPNRFIALIGSLFFVTSQPLMARVWHIALCAHWLILAALWLNLRPCEQRDAGRTQLAIAVLLLTAAGIHPYLLVILSALLGVLVLRLWLYDRFLSTLATLRFTSLLGVSLFIELYVYGFFVPMDRNVGDIRFAAADLLAFFNPHFLTKLLPSFELPGARYEGFAYLGAGVLILCIIASALIVARWRSWSRPQLKRNSLLIAITTVMMIYSFSTRLTLFGREIADFGLPLFTPSLGVFRGTGRFIWPMFYLLTTGSIIIVIRAFAARTAVAAVVLLATLSLQVYEQRDWRCPIEVWVPFKKISPDEGFALAKPDYKKLELYPPAIGECNDEYCKFEGVLTAVHLATELDMKINSGWFARRNQQREMEYRTRLEAAVASGHFDPQTLYVVHPKKLADFKNALCGRISENNVCINPENRDPIRALLESAPVGAAH